MKLLGIINVGSDVKDQQAAPNRQTRRKDKQINTHARNSKIKEKIEQENTYGNVHKRNHVQSVTTCKIQKEKPAKQVPSRTLE
jgi:hypothetical protein